MAADHCLRQSKLAPDVAHLVLEQFAQRFDEREAHPRLEATDVVMCFDGDRGTTARRSRLDDIRVERALHQEFGVAGTARRILEDIDERVTDDATFFLRVFHAAERIEETV